MPQLVLIDNYDSFTYNLVQLVRESTSYKVELMKNDQVDFEKINQFRHILISPGPGIPSEAGDTQKVIQRFAAQKSILGVCLGHQAIGEAFGAELLPMDEIFHGVSRPTVVTAPYEPLFMGFPASFNTVRYHSWALNRNSLPSEIQIIAEDQTGTIMAIKHRRYHVWGIQFHPESVLTQYGHQLIKNWLEIPKVYDKKYVSL